MKIAYGVVLLLMLAVLNYASTPLDRLEGRVVLRAAASPYVVSSSLVLSVQDTLIIEPGVQILVQGYRKILLRGLVKILGTTKKPVRIASADSGDTWVGLHLSTGKVPVDIQGLWVQDAFRNTISSSQGKISQSHFLHNYYGLWVESSPDLNLKDCEFRENRFGVSIAGGLLALNKSLVQDNVYGVWLDRDGLLVGVGNLIQGNQTTDISQPADSSRQGNSARFPKGVLQTVESKF